MTFDKLGNLFPYELIQADLELVEREFVDPFPNSTTRPAIFNAVKNYLNELRLALDSPFDVWLDGSFITMKQNPNDADFVIFVHTAIVRNNQEVIRRFRERRKDRKSLTDGYFEEVYPEGHMNYQIGLLNKMDRERLFGFDRNGNKKGIIQLSIS